MMTAITEETLVINKQLKTDVIWTLWSRPWLTGLIGAVILPLGLAVILSLLKLVDLDPAEGMRHPVSALLVAILAVAFVIYGAVVCPMLYATKYGIRSTVKTMFFTLLWLTLITVAALSLIARTDEEPDYRCGVNLTYDRELNECNLIGL